MSSSKTAPVAWHYGRNPVYVFYMAGAVLLFIVAAMRAGYGGHIGALEQDVFFLIFHLPELLTPLFQVITQFGGFLAIVVTVMVQVIRRKWSLAMRFFLTGTMAYVLAYFLKQVVNRPRPIFYYPDLPVRDQAVGLGFPSGHTAVAFALGLTICMYAPKSWRKWILGMAFLVGVSRVYLGVHWPIDVVGGFAVGLFCYSFVNLLMGSPYIPVSSSAIKRALGASGVKLLEIHPAKVDARGSVPFFGETADGKVFIKVYNKEKNAADWLFKLYRRIVYRRLEDESPFMVPKRSLEHEAYVSLLAGAAGINTPNVVGVYRVSSGAYAMATTMIDAIGLDHIESSKLSDAMLAKVWDEVKLLHESFIIHKDLRAANIMIDNKTGEPWIIDFGFSETAVSDDEFIRDTVELIASVACLVGADRSVEAATKAFGPKAIEDALPFMQYASLSGATTQLLKKRYKNLLKEITVAMARATGKEGQKIQKAKVTRISWKTVSQLGVIILLIVILAPQFDDFSEAMDLIRQGNPAILFLAAIVSTGTYLWASLTYMALSFYGLRFWRTYLVQWAASFANRLLPAGIGALGVSSFYLRKEGHNDGQSLAVASANNILGVTGNLILLAFAIMAEGQIFKELHHQISAGKIALLLSIIAVIGIVCFVVYKRAKGIQAKVKKFVGQILQTFYDYRHRPFHLAWALSMQLLVTLTYSLTLMLCGRAVGMPINFEQSVVAMSFGTMVASVTPTPGGVGGAEAGLVAAMNLMGFESSQSIATAVSYRLLTFWLPILPGYICYLVATKKHYLI